MKLAFLGASRTGTKSMWIALSKHPEIAGSIVKEPWNVDKKQRNILLSKKLDFYKKQFYINESSKILLDATPSAYCHFYDHIKHIKMPIKIIYPFRNPFDRLYSSVKLNIVVNSLSEKENVYTPSFIKGKFKVDYSKIMDYLHYKKDSLQLEHAYMITDEVFFTKFDDVIEDLTPVFNFLDLKPIDVKLERRNSMDVWYHAECDKIRKEFDLFWNYNIKNIAKFILDDLNKLKDRFDVEDYIIETENILSNV